MQVKSEYILSELEGVYDLAMRARTDTVFYKYVYDYIETFDLYPALVEVNKRIVDEAVNQDKPLKELEVRAINEIFSVSQIVRRYVSKNSINDTSIEKHLATVDDVKNGQVKTSLAIPKSLFSDLTYALMLLVGENDLTHLPFCRQFGHIDERGRIQNWDKLSIAYNEWYELHETKSRLHELSDIYAWDQIVEFHNWYKYYEVEAKKLIENRKYWELGYVAEKFRVIKSAISGEKFSSISVLKITRDDYERYLSKVHKMLKRYLLDIDLIAPDQKYISSLSGTVLEWSYNKDKGLLLIGDHSPIPFRRSLTPAQILKTITVDEASRTKEWSWDELFESIDKPINYDKYSKSDQYTKRHKFEDAVDNIIERVAILTKVNDFLIKDTFSVKINPIYHYKLS